MLWRRSRWCRLRRRRWRSSRQRFLWRRWRSNHLRRRRRSTHIARRRKRSRRWQITWRRPRRRRSTEIPSGRRRRAGQIVYRIRAASSKHRSLIILKSRFTYSTINSHIILHSQNRRSGHYKRVWLVKLDSSWRKRLYIGFLTVIYFSRALFYLDLQG